MTEQVVVTLGGLEEISVSLAEGEGGIEGEGGGKEQKKNGICMAVYNHCTCFSKFISIRTANNT